MHAKADHHPQHPDRKTAEMAPRPLRLGLTSASRFALGPRPSACKATDRRADGVKAVSRQRRGRASASLEAGRSTVYLTSQLLFMRARDGDIHTPDFIF